MRPGAGRVGQQLVTAGRTRSRAPSRTGAAAGWEQGVLPGDPVAALWQPRQQLGTLRGDECPGVDGLEPEPNRVPRGNVAWQGQRQVAQGPDTRKGGS